MSSPNRFDKLTFSVGGVVKTFNEWSAITKVTPETIYKRQNRNHLDKFWTEREIVGLDELPRREYIRHGAATSSVKVREQKKFDVSKSFLSRGLRA